MRLHDQFEALSNLHTGTVSIAGTQVLVSGVEYIVEFDGTWSAWGDGASGDPLNLDYNGPGQTTPPKYHIPGRIPQTHSQFSAEWQYGDIGAGSPFHAHTGISWSLDGGSTFVHDVEPIGGIGATWNERNHVFAYRLIGQGNVLRARMGDSNPNDNDGIIKIRVYKPSWTVGAVVMGPGVA